MQVTHTHTLYCQSSLLHQEDFYFLFLSSARPNSTDIIPPRDKPTMLYLQTLPDWNFLLQMPRASITSWPDNTKSDMRTCAHSSVSRTPEQVQFYTTQGSYCAGAGAGSAKMGGFEHRFIHNKCHHEWKVMVTLVGFTNSEVQHSWLERPRQLNVFQLISINSFRKAIMLHSIPPVQQVQNDSCFAERWCFHCNLEKHAK